MESWIKRGTSKRSVLSVNSGISQADESVQVFNLKDYVDTYLYLLVNLLIVATE